MATYEVISDVPVREAKGLTSKLLGKLGAGAVVKESKKEGERIQFSKVSGSGPPSGWIGTKALCKISGPKEVAAPYAGKSAFAVAEAKVMKEGAAKTLAEAGADGPGKLTAAIANLALGSFDKAAEAVSEALSKFSGNKDGEASANLALAVVFLGQDLPNEALPAATKALALFKELSDKQMIASALTTQANARIFLKEIGAATQAAKEAIATFRELGDADGEAAAELTLLDIYVAREGTEKGKKALYTEKAAAKKAKGDKKGEALALQELAETLMKSDSKEAAKAAADAVALFKTVGDKKLLCSGLVTASTASLASDAAAAVSLAKEAVDADGSAVAALNALTNAYIASGNFTEAASSSSKAQGLCKDDKAALAGATHLEATASLAKGDAADAAKKAKTASDLFVAEGDLVSAGAAMQTMVSAYVSMGGADGKAQALATAKDALGLFTVAGDMKGEATTLYMMASVKISVDGGATEALMAADRARGLFLTLGEKKYQGMAAHIVAQAQLLMGEIDTGMAAGMQAVVLARDSGDKWGEANALFTATNGQISKGHLAEGLRMAREAQRLFKDLGSAEGEACAENFVLKLEDGLPNKIPGPRTYISPMDDTRLGAQRSLFQEHPNCVIWTPAMNQQTYIMYSLELLKLVDDLKNMSTKTSVLAVSQGSYGRQTGEIFPGKMEAVYGNCVWAMVRTVRLESPRLHIASVDVPTGASAYEIAECLRAAQLDSGNRSEISYILDRKNKLKK